MKITPVLLLLAALLTFGCYEDDFVAGDDPIDLADDLDAYLMDEMEDQQLPALAALVFNEDGVVYERYFGEADLATGTRLTADHVFLLASVSKTVTATALLQLHDTGAFALDDPINAYLPFEVTHPEYATPITFRMLLTHSAAIADGPALDEQYYYGEDSPVALADFMAAYFTPGEQYYSAHQNFHNFRPGTQHEYSNTGSALIGVLVEQLSGEGFNAYCKANIFQPLGMTRTAWRLDETPAPLVTPYAYAGNALIPSDHYTFTDYPNGGLRSTARDMHRFLSAHASRSPLLGLKAVTYEATTTPQLPNSAGDVGLHFFLLDVAEDIWGHDGGEIGTTTIVGFGKDTGVGVLLFTNGEDAELEDMLLAAYAAGVAR